MNVKMIKEKDLLKRRLRYFFIKNNRKQEPVSLLISELLNIGPVAILGGMVRDIALGGNLFFQSDIDLVIDTNDTELLLKFISKYNIKKNSMDGYRIFVGSWTVDLWPLGRTWAFANGYVRDPSFKNLLKTTFFSWDSIVYSIFDNRVIVEDNYISLIHRQILDINLEPNPNPLGNIIRTLKWLLSGNAKIAKKLVAYVVNNQKNFTPKEVVQYDELHNDYMPLNETGVSCLYELLKCWNDSSAPDDIFSMPSVCYNQQVYSKKKYFQYILPLNRNNPGEQLSFNF